MASIYDWSLVPGENATADSSINWSEGQLPKTVNDSARNMMARLAAFIVDQGGAALVTGTNALTVSLNNVPTGLFDGWTFACRISNTNTGATTITWPGLGTKQVRKMSRTGDVQLDAGDLAAGSLAFFRYSSSANTGVGAAIIQNPVLGALAYLDAISNDAWSGADLSIANGGTGASTASAARSNLGLGTVATEDTVPIGKGGTNATTAAAARTNLGLGIGVNVQAYDDALQALSAPTNGGLGANRMIFLTGAGSSQTTDLTSKARELLAATTASAMRTVLALGAVSTEDVVPVAKGGTGAANASAARTNLGVDELGTKPLSYLGDLATKNIVDLTYTGASASQTAFPIGHPIACVIGPETARNGAVSPRIDDSTTYYYRADGSGALLAGTWRSSGHIGDSLYLVRRVA